jgi:hypothetical protein
MNQRPWTRHFGLPQIPVVILNPTASVQIKEDGVRGRCRTAQASDVDWERVTHWRWSEPSEATEGGDKNLEDLSFQECADERRQLASDRILAERELALAKRSQDDDAIRHLGHVIQTMSQRGSALKARLHVLEVQANGAALKQAAKDILSPGLLRQLYDRATVIQAEMMQ